MSTIKLTIATKGYGLKPVMLDLEDYEPTFGLDGLRDLLGFPDDCDLFVTDLHTDMDLRKSDYISTDKPLSEVGLDYLYDLLEYTDGWSDDLIDAFLESQNGCVQSVVDILRSDAYQVINQGRTDKNIYEAIGRAIANENSDFWDCPDWVKEFFDFERYGRSMFRTENITILGEHDECALYIF